LGVALVFRIYTKGEKHAGEWWVVVEENENE